MVCCEVAWKHCWAGSSWCAAISQPSPAARSAAAVAAQQAGQHSRHLSAAARSVLPSPAPPIILPYNQRLSRLPLGLLELAEERDAQRAEAEQGGDD